MKSKLMLVFGVTILFATITQAERKELFAGLNRMNFSIAQNCGGRPDFITEIRPEIVGGIKSLDQMVLVARDADYYIESKVSSADLHVHSYQSFAGGEAGKQTKIICGRTKGNNTLRYSLFAPTLIDTTAEKKVGQSLWQFQVFADKEGFSIWNKKSLAFNEGENLEKALMKFGGNYRIYQLSRNLYEIVVSKDTENVAQYLSIRFDVMTR